MKKITRLAAFAACVYLGVNVAFSAATYVQSTASQGGGMSQTQSQPQQKNSDATASAFAQSLVDDGQGDNNSGNASASSDKPKGAAAMAQSAQLTLLLSRVMQINQDFLNYQDTTNAKISKMQLMNQQLASQLVTLARQVSVLTVQVMGLQSQLSVTQTEAAKAQRSASNGNWFAQWQHRLGTFPFYTLIVVMALIIALVLLALWPKKQKNLQAAPVEVKSDYDYLATKEAIPAKLDLSRSYIAMGDFEGARTVLAEILVNGNQTQLEAAQLLLKQCDQHGTTD